MLSNQDCQSEQAFHAEIEANPNDDFVKLAYADWLEERGNAMADGIRWLVANGREPFVFKATGRFAWSSLKIVSGKSLCRLGLSWVVLKRVGVFPQLYDTYMEAYFRMARAAGELIAEGKLE